MIRLLYQPNIWYYLSRTFDIIWAEHLISSKPNIWYHLCQTFDIIWVEHLISSKPNIWYHLSWTFDIIWAEHLISSEPNIWCNLSRILDIIWAEYWISSEPNCPEKDGGWISKRGCPWTSDILPWQRHKVLSWKSKSRNEQDITKESCSEDRNHCFPGSLGFSQKVCRMGGPLL